MSNLFHIPPNLHSIWVYIVIFAFRSCIGIESLRLCILNDNFVTSSIMGTVGARFMVTFKLFLALIQLSFLTMDGVVASCEKALDEYRECN